jgi:hypothetical protein
MRDEAAAADKEATDRRAVEEAAAKRAAEEAAAKKVVEERAAEEAAGAVEGVAGTCGGPEATLSRGVGAIVLT